jgi:hypothetical protein
MLIIILAMAGEVLRLKLLTDKPEAMEVLV